MRLFTKNIWLVLIHAVSIILAVYTILLLQIFATPESIDYHLDASGGYGYISQIVKDEIGSRLPPELNDKILQKALAQNLLNNFVTADSIQRIAQPLLKAGAFVTSQPTYIEEDKVVIDTANYRNRLSAELTEMQIPESLQNISQKLVASIPDTLTLVDMEQRPNSILGFLTKAKTRYQQISTLNWILIGIAAISFLLIIFLNLKFIKQILLSIAYAYSIGGTFIVLGAWGLPYLYRNFASEDPHPIFGHHLNDFVENSVYYFFDLTRKYGWVYLLVALIALVLLRINSIQSLRLSLNKVVKDSPVSSKSNKKKNNKR